MFTRFNRGFVSGRFNNEQQKGLGYESAQKLGPKCAGMIIQNILLWISFLGQHMSTNMFVKNNVTVPGDWQLEQWNFTLLGYDFPVLKQQD